MFYICLFEYVWLFLPYCVIDLALDNILHVYLWVLYLLPHTIMMKAVQGRNNDWTDLKFQLIEIKTISNLSSSKCVLKLSFWEQSSNSMERGLAHQLMKNQCQII